MAGRPATATPTDWEMDLLHLFWENGSLTVDDVREILRAKKLKRSDSSIRTTLKAMVQKGLLKTELKDRVTYYAAAVKQERIEKKFFNHIIDSMFKGNQAAFILRALDESNITPEVVENLENIIKQHKKGK